VNAAHGGMKVRGRLCVGGAVTEHDVERPGLTDVELLAGIVGVEEGAVADLLPAREPDAQDLPPLHPARAAVPGGDDELLDDPVGHLALSGARIRPGMLTPGARAVQASRSA